MLLAFAPLGSHAAEVVLCIGADGHVSTELAEGAKCITSNTTGDAEHDAPDIGLPTADAHCGACTDIPLPTGDDDDCASFKIESSPSAHVVLAVAGHLDPDRQTPRAARNSATSDVVEIAVPFNSVLHSSVVLLI